MKSAIVKVLNSLGIHDNESLALIEIPKDKSHGDYAFPCFVLAQKLKKNPVEIARELAERMTLPVEISHVVPAGPYLNFFLNPKTLAKKTISEINKMKDRYGASKSSKPETIVIEMSSPNIAKPFGIGHLRSTIIGNSIAKIYRFMGHKTVTLNFLGDWGTPFGKIIAAYEAWGDEKRLKKEGVNYLLELYVRANADREFEERGRECFRKMEEGDKKYLAIWKRFRDLSVKEFERVYRLLGVKFDALSGESAYTKKMDGVVNEMSKKGLLEESEGATIVNLEKYGLGVALIKKSDGATLYITRDIAAALDRQRKYAANRLVYEVGSEQKLHFKQLFKILELLGYKWANACAHVDHGLYLDNDGKKFSTRKGKTVFMEEILNETVSLAAGEVAKRAKVTKKERDKRASAIARAAIFYGDLKNFRSNDMIFDIDRFVSFEGDTGPYLLYSYARAKSIMRKASKRTFKKEEADISVEEKSLIGELARFPEIVARAAKEYSPNIIAQYSFRLSQSFNEFYHKNQVIGSSEEKSRIEIVRAFAQTLKNALNLLGIDVIEEM